MQGWGSEWGGVGTIPLTEGTLNSQEFQYLQHQISIPNFLKDIGPIVMIFKTVQDESSGFSGTRLLLLFRFLRVSVPPDRSDNRENEDLGER